MAFDHESRHLAAVPSLEGSSTPVTQPHTFEDLLARLAGIQEPTTLYGESPRDQLSIIRGLIHVVGAQEPVEAVKLHYSRTFTRASADGVVLPDKAKLYYGSRTYAPNWYGFAEVVPLGREAVGAFFGEKLATYKKEEPPGLIRRNLGRLVTAREAA